MRSKKFLQKVEELFNSMYSESEKLYELKDIINNAVRDMYTYALKTLREENNEITKSLDYKFNLLLDNSIDLPEYKNEYEKFLREEKRIHYELKEYNLKRNAAVEFMPVLSLIISHPYKYKELNTEQKNRIIDLMFWQLGFKDQKVQYKFKKPFDKFLYFK